MVFIHLPEKVQSKYDNLFDDEIEYGVRTTAKLDKPLYHSIQKPTITYDGTSNLHVMRPYMSNVLCKITANHEFYLVFTGTPYPELRSVFNSKHGVYEFDFTNRGGNMPVGFNQFGTIFIKPVNSDTENDMNMITHWAEDEELLEFKKIFGKHLYGNICLWIIDNRLFMANWDGYMLF